MLSISEPLLGKPEQMRMQDLMALIHSLVDQGVAIVDQNLAKYSTMTGQTGYGDRGFT